MQIGADERAASWIENALDLVPDHGGAKSTLLELRLHRGEEYEETNYHHKPPQVLASFDVYDALQIRDIERLVLYHDLRAGRYVQARENFAQNHPQLLQALQNPEWLQALPLRIKRKTYVAAINLALILAETGEEDQAAQLLEDSLRVIETMPRLGRYGFQIADVMIYAIQGEREKALAALREAINDGWQFRARYLLEFEPNLFSLHTDPGYQAMVAEVKAGLAEQLSRVQEMEHRGELALPPGAVIEP
jgi:tetratricopeptide (TPR) repeat protein